MVALNAETEKRWWLWTSKLRKDNGTERQTMNDNFEHCNWEDMVALNVVTNKEWRLWNPSCKEMVALNAQTEKRWWLWTSKLRRDSGSECQIVKDDFERRNWEDMVALNAKLQGNDEGGNMLQCSVSPQLLIYWKSLKETLWVSKDAPLASWNNQIDYKYGLTIYLIKSRGLMMCHNKSDASNSKCSTGGVHCHLKWMIHWGVSRE